MTARKLREIPSYLHDDSELYRSLNHDEPDELIAIPDDCRKSDTSVDSLEALQSLLSTIRFWGIQKLPSTAIKYILTTHDDLLPILAPFDCDLRLSDVVRKIRASTHEHGTALDKLLICAEYGQLDIFRHFMHQSEGDIQHAFLVSAKHGHVECMRLVCDSGTLITAETLQNACYDSCSSGHLQCLRYSLELGAVPERLHLDAAVRGGHLDSLKLLCGSGCRLIHVSAVLAAQYGYYTCLEYILSNCPDRFNQVCTAAASAGRLDCVQLACNKGCGVDVTALAAAAYFSSIDCMQFAVQQGAVMDASVSEAACSNNHIHCLLFAIERHCAVTDQCMQHAAHHGNLEMMKLIAEQHVVPTAAACVAAAQAGQVDCLVYLHEVVGCTLNPEVLNAAARGGSICCLKYVYSKGYGAMATEVTAAGAASSGSVDCLRFLHENGCLWDQRAAIEAAWLTDKQCLEYITAVDEEIVVSALQAGIGPYGVTLELANALLAKTKARPARAARKDGSNDAQ